MDARALFKLLAEADALTRLPRAGWLFAGVDERESVADHCFQTAFFAYFLAKSVEGDLDVGKVLAMALFHELAEVRLVDLPRRAGKYIKKAKRDAEARIMDDVAGELAPELKGLWEELHDCTTLEARVVEAAEELQIIFKAAMLARAGKGELSEYIGDARNYDDQGLPLADALGQLVQEALSTTVDTRWRDLNLDGYRPG